MFLYNLTLQRPSAIYFAVHGSFSAPRAIELVLGRQTSLELMRPDDQGHLKSLCFQEIYGIIRSLKAFRLTGAKRDYLLVGSDSGKITVLVFNPSTYCFERVHIETFGKSGCRRIVPGEYLATDPKGRACMIGAIEKQKFVYVFNRDASENLTISSPLEAHKSSFICYDIIGLDVGFENPIFAALERAYDPPQSPKSLVFYELDLGLNHVVRKLSTPVEDDAYKILPVPGSRDGPGGVIVCSMQHIRYKSLQSNLPDHICPIPLRKDISQVRGNFIVSCALHRQKGLFFYLLCTELGDVFKLEMECTNNQTTEEETCVLKEMRIRYLDSLPCPANDMCILRNGFLFVASEYGNHGFYQFRSLGREQDFCCVAVVESKDTKEPVYFSIHENLENLLLIEEIESLSPLNCWQIGDFYREGSPQLIIGSGRRHRSAWKTLRLGYRWTEMAVSDLPGYPVGVFTVREQQQDTWDSYIIVSFVNASLILSVGETVEEVSDSGFSTNVSTIFVQLFSNNSIVQVHSQGIRHIRPDIQTVHEWKPPQDLQIQAADGNASQLVVVLSSKQLLYFELDETGMLTEIQEVELTKEESSAYLPCVSIAPLVSGQSKASFVAVSDGVSYYARLYSLKRESCLKPISLQALDTVASSLLLIWLNASTFSKSQLVLLIGSHSGIYIRALVDPITGALSEQQSRLVGTKPVVLQRIEIQGKPVALIVSSRSYFMYLDNQLLLQTLPISYERMFDHVVGFCSEQCPDGVIACCGSSLCILSFEEDRDLFQSSHLFYSDTQNGLYTPRRLIDMEDASSSSLTNDTTNHFKCLLTLEADQRIQVASLLSQDGKAPWTTSEEEQRRGAGYPIGSAGSWSCAMEEMNIGENSLKCALHNTESKEYISSICCIRFSNDADSSLYLCVGVVINYALQVTNPWESSPAKDNMPSDSIIFPRSEVRVYRWLNTSDSKKWEYLHTTVVQEAANPSMMEWSNYYGASHLSFHVASRYRNEIITAMASFQGRLLVAVGTSLRMYDLGKKQLLKKTQHPRATPYKITSIETCYDRIFLSDVQESVFLYRYSAADNLFLCIADDYLPKWCTSMCLLDYDTVAVGDKFGNISILRLPPEAGTLIEQDPTGGLWSKEAPHHFQLEACFYVGSVISCVSKVEWTTGDVPLLFYATLDGAIGVMIPLRSTLDMELFPSLELQMREYRPPLCGRHHLAYRSYFFPVRHVIDGDLCEEFYRLDLEQQEKIVKELDRSIIDVHRKLEDYRERIRYPYLPV